MNTVRYVCPTYKEVLQRVRERKVTDKEQEKNHLYAKLLSVITDEDRLKYEKALANLLTKKRDLNEKH